MGIEDFERDGWERIDTFSDLIILALDDKRIAVDQSGEIIIRY